MVSLNELEGFEKRVQGSAVIRPFLADIVSGGSVSSDGRSRDLADVGIAGLWAVANVGLLLLLKMGVDHLRGMSELAIAKRRLKLIDELVKDGYDRAEASSLIERLLTRIRSEPDNSAVLESLKLLQSASN